MIKLLALRREPPNWQIHLHMWPHESRHWEYCKNGNHPYGWLFTWKSLCKEYKQSRRTSDEMWWVCHSFPGPSQWENLTHLTWSYLLSVLIFFPFWFMILASLLLRLIHIMVFSYELGKTGMVIFLKSPNDATTSYHQIDHSRRLHPDCQGHGSL